VAVMVYTPSGEAVSVNVQPLKSPSVAPESAVEHALGEPIVPPPLLEKVIETLGVNPVPEAVIVTPLGPCVGDRTSAGVVISKEAVALSKAPSDPVAVMV
jgi:hypothetical protein